MISALQKNPTKLYIQDVYRAKRCLENKYVYKIFGLAIKNVMIHGVITSVNKNNNKSTNLEVSDATGTVLIFYDSKKSNFTITKDTYQDLIKGFSAMSRMGHEKTAIMSRLLDNIEKKYNDPINFEVGDYVCVIGDIFVDSLTNVRKISAYQCSVTSAERDIIWMEELRYIYEKFYLWEKETG